MKHIMIDLETLGTNADSVFIAIGAVYFDIETGVIGKEFYYNGDWQSSIDEKRKVDADTLKWWLKQSDEARASLFKTEEINFAQTLWHLRDFLQEEGPAENIKVWANGSCFDIAILEHSYGQYNEKPPWKFWNVRDVRTIKDLGKDLVDKSIFKIEGTAHNALDDAKHQAKYVSVLWQAIKKED